MRRYRYFATLIAARMRATETTLCALRAAQCCCVRFALGVTDSDSDSELYTMRYVVPKWNTAKTHTIARNIQKKKFAYKQKSREESQAEPDPRRAEIQKPNSKPKKHRQKTKKWEKKTKPLLGMGTKWNLCVGWQKAVPVLRAEFLRWTCSLSSTFGDRPWVPGKGRAFNLDLELSAD